MVVEPSVASRTACDLLGIGLAGLLVIEEHQEAQAFPLLAICGPAMLASSRHRGCNTKDVTKQLQPSLDVERLVER
jgi:hypothetical protein